MKPRPHSRQAGAGGPLTGALGQRVQVRVRAVCQRVLQQLQHAGVVLGWW